MLKNKLQIILSLIFLGFVGWWLSFQSVVANQGLSVEWFEGIYGLVALTGALVGFIAARKWGGFRTVLGRALIFFSIGLFAQEAGQMILNYYIYVSKIQIPYPSWGDVAYFGSTLSYGLGAFFMAKAAGIKFSLKNNKYKAVAVVVPVALLATSYWVFLHNHQYDWHRPLTVFLDLGYPIGDATYISLAIVAYLLSRKMLGGLMRRGILILILALFFQYISDFSFLYQGNRGTYLAGQWVDLVYLIAYFVMTIAMISFLGVYRGLRQKTANPTAKAD